MQLEYAKDPKWANAEHTMIDLTIKWVEIDEELPFTASPNDTEEHGRAIFAATAAGGFGPIAPYVPHVPTSEELSSAIRAERDRRIAVADWTQLPDVPEETRQLWADYRQALRDVPQQATFPDSVKWPEKPA